MGTRGGAGCGGRACPAGIGVAGVQVTEVAGLSPKTYHEGDHVPSFGLVPETGMGGVGKVQLHLPVQSSLGITCRMVWDRWDQGGGDKSTAEIQEENNVPSKNYCCRLIARSERPSQFS